MKMFSSMQWLMFTGILLFAFACEKDPVPPVVNPPDPTDTSISALLVPEVICRASSTG